jgi:GDP-mannose 6-dehydrogenase
MGYVGVVTASCFAQDGHDVTGVDPSLQKVALINDGQSPIVEEGISELVKCGVESSRLRAVSDGMDVLGYVDIAIICVGTPSQHDGSLDHSFVLKVCKEIGSGIRGRSSPILLIFRSTMVPGSMRTLVIPALEQACGASQGTLFRAVFHPEFLREGSSVKDFYNPPKIVVGADSAEAADLVFALYPSEYSAPRITCGIEVAEMVKYTDNLFHAVKITFANEIGQFCHSHRINSQQVMQIFCQDTKLNLSPYYLKPGFAFGGSCLPKDLRAFLAEASRMTLTLPMLQGVLPSNRHQLERVLALIITRNPKRVGFYGLAFKQGTDDLRESPYVELAERLMGKGKELVFFDKDVHVSRLVGRNKSYIENAFPHLSRVLVDDITALDSCDLLLTCHRPDCSRVSHWKSLGIALLDLTGVLNTHCDSPVDAIV